MSELRTGLLSILVTAILLSLCSISIAVASFDAHLTLPDPAPPQSSVLAGMGISTCGCIAPEFRMLLGESRAQELARREYWQRRCYNSLDLCEQLTITEWFEGVEP